MRTASAVGVVLLFLISLNICLVKCRIALSLNGDWTLSDDTETYIDIDAVVPGGIYSDLMELGAIEDVFFGFNDEDTRWVAKRNWTYTKTFELTALPTEDNVNIVFDGVDTFATVTLNDVVLGKTQDMFIRYVYDIKTILQEGTNVLTVQFESPLTKADELYDEQAEEYIVPPQCVEAAQHGECHVNHIRKMQASYSWDWGPAFPSVGLWKRVYIEAFSTNEIRAVTVNLKQVNSDWVVTLKTYFAIDAVDDDGQLIVSLPTTITYLQNVYDVADLTEDEDGEFYLVTEFNVQQEAVNLWWPNGYGNPSLHQLNVTYVGGNRETSIRLLNIGFRTIELVEDDLEDGSTFYFKVNNVPIFAKGSNLIPISILPERDANTDWIWWILGSARDANMNMLRVWGGGMYESDELYDIADQIGILIWQDFMFACSMYPVTEDFLSTVRTEVRQQVKRLQHHASIAIWAGNNENESALRDNWYGTGSNFSLYETDYVKLYVDTIKKEALGVDENLLFITSSPSNGKESDEEGYVARNPQSHLYGDVHYYNYFLDSWNPNIYPIPRFASEYGYQSLPSPGVIFTATHYSQDMLPHSTFLTHRQHKDGGNDVLLLQIGYQLNLPPETSANFYKAFSFYSQISQAMAIKIESEFYRSWRSRTNDAHEGYTMGALYWQINDVWVAPTWSSIDFLGQWKMLQYYAQKFFAPVIVTGYINGAGVFAFYAVSDLQTTLSSALVTVSIYNWNSLTPVEEIDVEVDIAGGFSTEFLTGDIDEYLAQYEACGDAAEASTNCFFYLTTVDSSGEQATPDNFLFPAPLKDVELITPTITVESIEEAGDNTFKITLSTDAISLFVWLETPIGGRWSENGFIQVTPTKEVFFSSYSETTADELLDTVTVVNLLDAGFF